MFPKIVSIINGICIKNDAISASVRDDIETFSFDAGFITKLYSYDCEFDELNVNIVKDINGIIFDPHFYASHLIVYHFGIYYDLFNAIIVGNGHAAQVVRYHNLTPRSLLPLSEHRLSYKSNVQLHNLATADAVWPVSDFNKTELIRYNITEPRKIEMIPLCVGKGQRHKSLRDKTFDVVRLLFVGRFVRAKGLTDLVRAAKKLKDRGLLFQLRLVGEQRFSHVDLIREVEDLIVELELVYEITIVGSVSDDILEVEYGNAHILVIPSYHEGFCKPVVEAMSWGCIPITYDSYNLKFVARGLSRTVTAGNIDSLGDQIYEVAGAIRDICVNGAVRTIALDVGNVTLDEYEYRVNSVLTEYGFSNVANRLRFAALALISSVEA